MDEKFTLTCMNQAMAQRMGGEYVCEDEWGEEYPSSLPCDEEACVAACSICGQLSNQEGYGILLDFIEKNPVNKFLIDSNVSYGGYNSTNQSVVFNSSATIDSAIREELLHHMQNVLYEDGISQYNICSDGIIPNNDKLFNTNGETNKDYNYFLNLYNNKGPYSSPLKENLSPLLFNYMNSHQ